VALALIRSSFFLVFLLERTNVSVFFLYRPRSRVVRKGRDAREVARELVRN